jgi:type II secretory pathway pseudopilin PulG
MRRVSAEDGFTIVELLAAMVVGMLVLFAAFGLVQIATGLTRTTEDRVDAAQRGRAGMEAVTTQLRSMVCVTDGGAQKAGPLVAASGSRVDFYANTRTPDSRPELRVLTYDPTQRRITLTSTPGQAPPSGLPVGAVVLPYTGAATTRTVLTDVLPIDGTTPIFRFMTYDAAKLATNVLDPVRLADPVPAADLSKVVWVEVNFRVRPTGATANSGKDAIFKSKAYFRVSDPTKLTAAVSPSNGIAC